MQLKEKFITLEKVLEETKQLIEKQPNKVKSKMPKNSMNISEDIQQITDHQLNNTTSKSAILLKILNKDWNMGKLQELLNKKLQKNLELPPITSKLNKKKDIMILKSSTEDYILSLLKFLENIDLLKDSIELAYSANKNRRLIILGIPKIFEEEQVIFTDPGDATESSNIHS